MRVLVTGGGGYLGTWVVRKLLENGHSVRIFDRFCFGREALEMESANPACELVEGDVRRLQETPEVLDNIDAIAHLASLSNDPTCALDPEITMDVNVESTLELAQLAINRKISRFILASSCTVYGNGVFELLDEASPPNPVTTFGRAKLAAEEALLGLSSEDFEPVVCRMATMFGWSPRMRFDVAVNQMVATALREGIITVRGGGNQWRPFVHIQDAAQGILSLLEAPATKVSGEIFNMGSDLYNTSIIELAHRVAKHFPGVKVEIAKDDDDLRTFRVQFAKIRRELGFKCHWSIDEGIEEVRRFLEDEGVDPFAEEHFNIKRMKHLLATPVDEGGEPVAARFIPLSRPNLGKEEEEATLRALRSGWLTSGPQISAFEQAFSREVDAPATVAVSSCTAALHLCLEDAGVGAGDEVITSPITWSSTGNTILNMGAKVKFVDVDPLTLNLDPAQLEEAITDRTRAIMPVHMAGHPCDLDAIYTIANRHGIAVIEDAAHALGAAYKGSPIGHYGEQSCFSFYAIKNITTIEGGMVALKDPEKAARLRMMARNGMCETAWDRYGRSAAPTPAQVVTPGYKYLMGNVSAAIGLEQLKKFSQFKTSRNRVATMYTTVLSELDEIITPTVAPEVEHAWHLYMIRFKLDKLTKTRDELAYLLRRENIGTGVHFYGLHLHQYYRDALGMRPEDLPEATRASEDILSLPLHPGITDKNIHEVVTALKKVLSYAMKCH